MDKPATKTPPHALDSPFDRPAQEPCAGEQEALSKLEEVLAAKEAYFGMALHDLKGALHVSQGYLDLLTSCQGQAWSNRHAAYLENLQIGLAKIADRINDIRTVQLIEQGRFPLHPAAVHLPQVLWASLSLWQLEADSREILLHAHMDDDLPSLLCDKSLVERVVDNLIDNALRHCTRLGSVALLLRRDGEGILVRVENSGTHLALPENEPRLLLDPAGLAPGPGAPGSPHWGVGLVFCARAVEAHGGSLWLEPGTLVEGTAYVFRLPCAPPDPGEQPHPA